jgi:TPR repeat protein
MLSALVFASFLLAVETAGADELEEARGVYHSGDYATAVELLRPLAERGNAGAQHLLGGLYEAGKGVPQNKAEAAKWHQNAANQGHAAAEFKVGEMYYNGWAIEIALQPRDYEWIEKGLGVPRYYAKALEWWRRSAAQGYAPAQSQLSFMYANGMGVRLDHRESVRWSRLAANQGHASAQYNLGASYYGGHGVGQDYAEAAKWFRSAAEQGDTSSQIFLGFMYSKGEGVERNYVLAYLWYSLAAQRLAPNTSQHNDRHDRREKTGFYGKLRADQLTNAIRNRDFLATLMTDDQIGEALRLAAQWKAK